jgi:hypothetical protein
MTCARANTDNHRLGTGTQTRTTTAIAPSWNIIGTPHLQFDRVPQERQEPVEPTAERSHHRTTVHALQSRPYGLHGYRWAAPTARFDELDRYQSKRHQGWSSQRMTRFAAWSYSRRVLRPEAVMMVTVARYSRRGGAMRMVITAPASTESTCSTIV